MSSPIRKDLMDRAREHMVYEESSTEVDENAVHRLAFVLALTSDESEKRERDWWHRKWHQDTGIPCDGTEGYCPAVAREKERRRP